MMDLLVSLYLNLDSQSSLSNDLLTITLVCISFDVTYCCDNKLLNPCRDGKRLLVLDIDYTLFDHRSPAENPLELMRPCKCTSTKLCFSVSRLEVSCHNSFAVLHEFLAAAYAEYDIMIWSATK